MWRFRVDGQRADHMAMSPDGKRVAVSASTGNVVHILDTFTGQEVGRFPSGDSPHENNYSADGQRIYHASIGLVYTPADQPEFDTTKGDRCFQIVDANTNQIIEQLDMGQKLAEAGYPNMSSAVRPMALSPDERGSTSRSRSSTASSSTTSPRTGSPASPTCRTWSRRSRASSTCSTPRTTASR